MGTNKQASASRKLWKLGLKDFNTQYFDFNKDGDLIAKEGNNIYNIRQLAEKYGTSLEILFPYIVEERVEDLLETDPDWVSDQARITNCILPRKCLSMKDLIRKSAFFAMVQKLTNTST